MPSNSSYNAAKRLAQAEILSLVYVMTLAQWVQHYQAETIDLRYFFHSGWSS
jgi:hypothetical protein